MPPLWPDHENFLPATLYEKVRFSPFSSKFQKKMGEFAAFIERSKAKSVSASGGLRPLAPRPGALPLDPAGGSAPRLPLKARALRARHAPLCQILNTPLCIVDLINRKPISEPRGVTCHMWDHAYLPLDKGERAPQRKNRNCEIYYVRCNLLAYFQVYAWLASLA